MLGLCLGCSRKESGTNKDSAQNLESLETPTGAPPKKLTIAISQEFENLNPIISSMLATSYISGFVGRGLMVLDPEGIPRPSIVEEIPSLENGLAKIKDGVIEANWKIKKTAMWGDGTPVTCQDVKLTWEIAKTDTVSIPEREMYTNILSITSAPNNPKHCLFRHKKLWSFSQLSSFRVVPAHLEGPIFKKFKNQKEGYDRNSLYAKDPKNPGLYNGPFQIADIQLGSHVKLVPNETFFKSHPKPKSLPKEILIKLIPNTGTLEANLRSGTVDMISVLGVSFDQAVLLEKELAKSNLPVKVHFKPSLVYEHININMENPIFADKRVRKALLYAIHREDLTQALFSGKQIPALHNLSPSDPWYTEDPKDIVLYPYSRRKAIELLEQAGYVLPKGETIREKDGKKLQFELITTAGNKARELVMVYLKDQWKQVGIDVQIKTEQARSFFGETVRKGNYSGLAMYAWISSPETSPRSVLSSDSIPTEKNGYSGQNSMKWRNAKVDELLNDLDQEFNAEKRKKIVADILREYTEEVPVIPLYYRSDISVTPLSLTGYRLTGHQYSPSHFVEEWFP